MNIEFDQSDLYDWCDYCRDGIRYNSDGDSRQCECCHGAGYLPTELGKTILRMVAIFRDKPILWE